MLDPLAVLVVSVPEEYFPEGDDLCLKACGHVCGRLEAHLIQYGHAIADWIRGGCDEDWGVYFESQCDCETFDYSIVFFPAPAGQPQNQLAIQYGPKLPLVRRLFGRPRTLDEGHRLHQAMREFGSTFSSSRMLTRSQFESEY